MAGWRRGWCVGKGPRGSATGRANQNSRCRCLLVPLWPAANRPMGTSKSNPRDLGSPLSCHPSCLTSGLGPIKQFWWTLASTDQMRVRMCLMIFEGDNSTPRLAGILFTNVLSVTLLMWHSPCVTTYLGTRGTVLVLVVDAWANRGCLTTLLLISAGRNTTFGSCESGPPGAFH